MNCLRHAALVCRAGENHATCASGATAPFEARIHPFCQRHNGAIVLISKGNDLLANARLCLVCGDKPNSMGVRV